MLAEFNYLIHLILVPLMVGLTGCSSFEKKQQNKIQSYLKSSCKNYKDLAQDKDFILQDVATLKAYRFCKDTKGLPDIESVNINQNKWLEDLYFDAQIKINENKKNNKEVALYKIEKALSLETERARLELLTEVKEKYLADLSEPEAQNLTNAIYNLSPSLIPSPEAKDWLKVAGDYRKKRDFSSAQSLYLKVIAEKSLADENKRYAFLGLAQNYKLQGKKSEHIKALYNYSRWLQKKYVKTKNPVFLGSLLDNDILYARALWTEGRASEAYSYSKLSITKLKRKLNIADFYILLARMHEEKNELSQTIDFYQKALKEKQNSPSQLSKIYWGLSWTQRKMKNYPESIDSFLKLIEITTNPNEKFKYQYWLAANYQDSGNTEEAQKILESLRQEDLSGYYGVLAFLTDKKELPPLLDKKVQVEEEVSKIPQLTILKFDTLIQIKEYDLAKKFVDELTANLKKSGELGATESLHILKKYAQSGLYLPLFANFNLLEHSMKNQIMRREPDLLFPKRYDDIIIAESEKANIPKELTFSIIRQESAFNPEARSPADAFGLMQVLPSVAAQTAKRNSINYVSHNDLFKPELNIAIGTQLLNSLLKKHNYDYIISIASYNAAESAVKGWVRTRYNGNTLEFIEDVPYEETKAYIKLVLRNMVFYQRLLAPNKPHTLNEEWFSLKK